MTIQFYYENTALTIANIAKKLNIPFDRVYKHIKREYSSEYRKTRKAVCYRNSKLGAKNPQFGLRGAETGGYVGDVSDGKGYLMRNRPEWFTGRAGSRHIFVHHLVVCEHLGLTAIPKGWVVHHCDFNPHNNDFNNLVLMLMGEHMKLHRYLLGATTISKESTLKWVETYGTPWRNDIVYSSQECEAAKAVEA